MNNTMKRLLLSVWLLSLSLLSAVAENYPYKLIINKQNGESYIDENH